MNIIKKKILIYSLPFLIPLILLAFVILIACMLPMIMFAGQECLTNTNDTYYAGSWSSYDGENYLYTYNGNTVTFPIPPSVKYSYTNSFGADRNHNNKSESHEGIDIFADRNTPALAVEDCKIDKIGWNGLGGWRILMTSLDNKRTYYYAHFENYSPSLQIYKDYNGAVASNTNIVVKAGEVIGYIGSSGSTSSFSKPGADTGTPPHIHFQLYKDGNLVNPYDFLKELEGIQKSASNSSDLKIHTFVDIRYRNINTQKLQEWLDKKRNSKLSEEPYFSTIISVAKDSNLNPFLMFAVVGQEQSYVPRTNPRAQKIANNPFNVTKPGSGIPGSWQTYNPGIETSAKGAAKTILRLSKNCPATEDVIKWINRDGHGYAEDKNWWKGVSKNLSNLEKNIGYFD